MRDWKGLARNVGWVALGFALLWFGWDMWRQIGRLESGEIESLKVWAPVALIYNLGGAWRTVAKLALLAFLWAAGLSAIYFNGIDPLLARRRPASPEPPPMARQPEPEIDSTLYDVSVALDVTRTQVARAEEVVIAGPNGPFAVKLHKKFRNGRLRFPHEGRERRGDLYVVLTIRDA